MVDLQKEHDALQNDCLDRLRKLRWTLDSINKRVRDDDILNDLGELQSEPGMLDCRLASLATVRSLMREME